MRKLISQKYRALWIGLGLTGALGATALWLPRIHESDDLLPRTPAASSASTPLGRSALEKKLLTEIRWVLKKCLLRSGAIAVSPTKESINPYFSNLFVYAMLRTTREHDATAVRWFRWYFDHLNRPDRHGIPGTIDDYRVNWLGKETPTGDADSTDSYAATLLLAVGEYLVQTRDRAFLETHFADLQLVAKAALATQKASGLTEAKPDYAIAYTMDNVEVWAGLKRWADALAALGYASEAAQAQSKAARIQRAIEKHLWNAKTGTYVTHFGAAPEPWTKLYPHASASLWTLVFGLPEALPRASLMWKAFQPIQPRWVDGSADSFAWAAIASAAIRAGDAAAAERWNERVERRNRWVRSWPWHVGESAGVMLYRLAQLEAL